MEEDKALGRTSQVKVNRINKSMGMIKRMIKAGERDPL